MIPSRRVFEDHAGDYDQWFDDHGDIYAAQVSMLRNAMPDYGRGLEVGIGSGRFALPFDIQFGIDPSGKLLHMAKNHGIDVVVGEGEHLPYRSGSFDYVLMMTVICFLDDIMTVFHEVNRVLTPGGMLIVGFIEKDGEIQREFLYESTKGRFLRYAKFRAVSEVAVLFYDAEFAGVSIIERTRGFCVMKGAKKSWCG
jgi:ubiquinone/menaquinone biosynthesis C-methylase UbiE